MTMGEALLELLDYQDVLGMVATTTDGLVVAAAGVGDDDAELVAAAGSAFARVLAGSDVRQGALPMPGGAIHVVVDEDLMLVGLTEPGVPGDELRPMMDGVLAQVGGALRGDQQPA